MADEEGGAKCAHCGAANDAWIPKNRLDDVIKERRAAKAAADEIAAKLAAADERLAAAAELEARLAQVAGERDRLALEGAIMGAGITDREGVSLAALAWSALAEDARPSEGIGAWLTSDAAPRGVRAYLPSAAPPAAPPAPPAPKGTPGNAGVVPGQPPASGQLTAAQIDAMTPDQYRQHRAALLRG